MRKLTRPPEPPQLLENKETLTQEYREKGNAVWRKDYIIEALFRSSNGKCAYCENTLVWTKGDHSYAIEYDEDKQYQRRVSDDENSFLHVDHFIAKKHDKDKVVEWSNLIPSCPACNYKKNAHDVLKYPILNPYTDNPKEYFTFSECTYIVKCSIGADLRSKASKTIALFAFIDRITPRIYSLNSGVQKMLGRLMNDVEEAIKEKGKGDFSKINELHQLLTNLLKQGLPCSKYGTLIATIILKHHYYSFIKDELIKNELWTDELIGLENQLKSISYE